MSDISISANQIGMGESESEETNINPSDTFVSESLINKYVRGFRTRAKVNKIRINTPPSNVNPLTWLHIAIKAIVDDSIKNCKPSEYVGFEFNSVDYLHGSAGMSFRPVNKVNFNELWELIFNISQSISGHHIDDSFIFSVTTVENPVGRRGNRCTSNLDIISKRSFVKISNIDNLCLPRALVVGVAHINRGKIREGALHREYKKISNRFSLYQRDQALQLLHDSGVEITPAGGSYCELIEFQKYFASKNIVIRVYELFTMGKKVPLYFDGSEIVNNLLFQENYSINLILSNDHYDLIINLKGACGNSLFCPRCNVSFRYHSDHKCQFRCTRCFNADNRSCDKKESVYCQICNRSFFGRQCFDRHLQINSSYSKSKTVCQSIRFCNNCNILVDSFKGIHQCNIRFCKSCKSMEEINHQCFITTIKREVKPDKTLYIYFDLETRQDEPVEGCENVNIHIPTLAVAQVSCAHCVGDNFDEYSKQKMSEQCASCGVREFFFTKDPIRELVELCLLPRKNFTHIVCLAHCGASFDFQYILSYLVDNKNIPSPRVIINGTKIITISLGKVKFLDSFKFLPMKLANIPKALNLSVSLKKGVFPHFFNTKENQCYIGEMPDLHYYNIDKMFSDERDMNEFLLWYQNKLVTNYVFNFQNEIKDYCKNDVDILRQGCIKFNKLFYDTTSVSCFTEACTIASTAMRSFRKNHLKPRTISLIPRNGYRMKDTQSKIALEWFTWLEHEMKVKIIHMGRGREMRFPGIPPVDGVIKNKDDTFTLLSFYGCFFHSCPLCFTTDRQKNIYSISENKKKQTDSNYKIKFLSHDMRYERTINIANEIRRRGFTLIEQWECKFIEQKRSNPEINRILSECDFYNHSPLDPRDAFFGGRVENIVMCRDVQENEKIKFIDFCSLYPASLKLKPHIIFHPEIFIGKRECEEFLGSISNIDKVEGLIKCTILPPRNMFIPILPVKMNGKLMFPLCYSCCSSLEQNDCPHEDIKDRMINGTWVSHEIQYAVKHGYTILEIFEIWQYKSECYDSIEKKGGLFSSYIDSFLKIKQESSGFPQSIHEDDDEAKERYISEYELHEGIKLDKNKIEKNPGLRTISKLALNSIFGKFCESSHPQTRIIKTHQELLNLLSNHKLEIKGVLPVNDHTCYVNYSHCDDAVEPTPFSNVVVGAYTTCHSRIELHKLLHRLNKNVLYFDTDSCIYVDNESIDDFKPPLGPYLGNLTDELIGFGEGSYADSFVCAAPKFYALSIVKGGKEKSERGEICKVKGITLNCANKKLLNYNKIREMIFNESSLEIDSNEIRRTIFHDVVTRKVKKVVQPVSTKRRMTLFSSLPYGYKHE